MAHLKADIRDYVSAWKFLGSALNRTLGHNTYVAACSTGPVAVWLHRTAVVRVYADGSLRLDSGGWQTVTTADRIRQTLPVGFALESHPGRHRGTPSEWYVVDNRPNRFPQRWAPFVDGMLIDPLAKGNPFRG